MRSGMSRARDVVHLYAWGGGSAAMIRKAKNDEISNFDDLAAFRPEFSAFRICMVTLWPLFQQMMLEGCVTVLDRGWH
jgi:hypothetical protein